MSIIPTRHPSCPRWCVAEHAEGRPLTHSRRTGTVKTEAATFNIWLVQHGDDKPRVAVNRGHNVMFGTIASLPPVEARAFWHALTEALELLDEEA